MLSQTMLAHFQDEAHKLHEQVQAQEREVRSLLTHHLRHR